jgi:hypothetical protein
MSVWAGQRHGGEEMTWCIIRCEPGKESEWIEWIKGKKNRNGKQKDK